MILSALQIKGGQRFLACFGANAPWLRYLGVINRNSFSSKFFFLATKMIIWIIIVISLTPPPIIICLMFQWERCSGAAVGFSLQFACSSLIRRQSGYRCECECGYFHWHPTPGILGQVPLAAPHIQPVGPFLWPWGDSITQLLRVLKSKISSQYKAQHMESPLHSLNNINYQNTCVEPMYLMLKAFSHTIHT